jgi:hypothetical protein
MVLYATYVLLPYLQVLYKLLSNCPPPVLLPCLCTHTVLT